MERISQFFNVSHIDSEDERRRRLLYILLTITLGLAGVGFAYAFFLDTADLASELVIHSLYRAAVMSMISVVVTYAISRYWTSRLAGLIFALLFTISIILNPGEETLWENIYLFLGIPILISSFLAFPWTGFVMAGIVSLWVALVAQETEAPFNIPAVLGYFSLAAVVWLSSRSLEHTLNRLRTTNRELDRRIIEQERTKAALQQRNRELSLLNHAGQAFNSTLDLDEVLANVFDEIQHVTNADAWSIWLTDRETNELVCYLVAGPQKKRIAGLRLKMGEGVAGWTALHKETVLIPDANDDPRIIRALNGFPKFDMRSVLSVPFIRQDSVIGVIQILALKPNLFTAEDQALLEFLATSAAAAIDNAQLYEAAQRDIAARKEAEAATARRHRELTALNAIASTLNQTHDLEELLGETLDEISSAIGVDTVWLQLSKTPHDDNAPVIMSRDGCPDETPPTGLLTPAVRENLMTQVQKTGELICIENIAATLPTPGADHEQHSPVSVVVLPIKAREDVEGALGVVGLTGCQKHPLNAEDIQLLATISHQIGIAVENIRLVREAAEVKALRALEKLRAELIANFSHDLRTPLGLIKMSCTTLMRDDVQFKRETQTACLEDIETQVDALTEIVDNILDLARIESGQLKLNKHPADLVMLAKGAVNATRARLAQHAVTLDFPEVPVIAEVDPQLIATVFHNLLDNAIKYSQKGTAITVSGRVEDEHILVQVSDQGIGIPAEALDKVFERFYRVESKATRHIRGVGLGLAVCHGIITAHNGRIWAESILGQGSTFSFTLPVLSNSVVPQ